VQKPAAMPNGVYRVGNGVTAPSLLMKVEPQYTQEARDGKIQGTTLLYVEIDPDGTARNMKVARSLEPGLDQKAIDAVSQWKFRPGAKDGVPVTVAATIEVNFRLQ
jgi:TonB family protein